MSHNYLSKSYSGFFIPSSQKPKWESLACILGANLIKTHKYSFGDLLAKGLTPIINLIPAFKRPVFNVAPESGGFCDDIIGTMVI